MANPIPPRQPIPLGRSIRWVPVRSRTPTELGEPDIGEVEMDAGLIEDHAIFITQQTLREIGDHVRTSAGEEILGFLLGERFETPDDSVHYAVITTVVRTGHVISEEEPVQIPNEEWLGIQLEVRRRRLDLIGWYHTAPFVSPNPARLDLDTQRARFPEPWQCGLVISTGPQPAGGFFRARPTSGGASGATINGAPSDAMSGAMSGTMSGTPGGATAGAFVPFYELLDDAPRLGRARRTLIAWRNYATPDPEVELDESISFAAWSFGESPTPDPFGAPGAQGTPGIPGAPGMAGVPGSPGVAPPVLIPTHWDEDDEDSEDGRPPRRPPRKRARWPAILAVLVLAAVGAWLLRPHRASDPFASRAAAARDTLSSAGAIGATGSTVSATHAPVPIPGGVRPAPAGSSSVVSPSAGTTSTAGAPTRDSSAAPQTPAASTQLPPNPSLTRFDRLADSLQQATFNYRTRRSDFDLHRIDCAGLARGYRAADDALIALAALYREVHDQLTGAQTARYGALVAAMDTVNGDFGTSRCPRP